MRLVLAKLLLQEADFYLFDEPTNHLDIVTKEWFFDFIKNGRFGFLLVSHDRYYLDKACDYIFELERGKGKWFVGNFSQYILQKEQQQAIIQASYERQQKDIAQKQKTIERFRASATKAKMAQSMIKQLDKVELIEVEPPLPTIKLQFPTIQRSGTTVLSFENLKQVFDNKVIFQNINGQIQRGEKIALVAPNGTGKTTLFNNLTGKYKLTEGLVKFGHNVNYAIFEQDQNRALDPNNTIYREVLNACPDISEAVIRGFLGSFLFSGESIHKKISVLSGGEKNRVAMVKVLLQKANFLLLDEPTNHLDLYAKDVLLQALKQYEGTLLIVSHDHSFLQGIATCIWELTPQGIHAYPGTYESYLYAKKALEQGNEPKATSMPKPQAQAPKTSKDSYNLRKEIASTESKISRLEGEILKLNNVFGQQKYGSAGMG